MKRIHRIYFDSNVVLKEGWPRVSAALDGLLWVAKVFKISVVLLDVVARELEAHWMREYKESRRAIQGLAEIHARIGLPAEVAGLPKVEEALAAYRRTVGAVEQEHGLVRVKGELRPTSEMFEMAIRESRPFQKKGRNFQDTVILLAAIDDLAKNPGQTGVFLSKDGVFEQSVVSAHSGPRKVELTLFMEVNQLFEVLRNELSEALKKVWDAEQVRAVDAVQQNAASLKDYIAHNLEIPANTGFEGEILSIKDIEELRILAVQTSDPAKKEENQPVSFTVEAEVSFRAITAPSLFEIAFATRKVHKVGGEAKIVRNPWLAEMQPNEPRERIIKRVVLVETRAKVADKGYKDFEFLSVKLK
jgi:hypothetical protein